jgi:hypothetical protein
MDTEHIFRVTSRAAGVVLLADVTIPFVSDYKPLWTSTGIVACWLMIILGLAKGLFADLIAGRLAGRPGIVVACAGDVRMGPGVGVHDDGTHRVVEPAALSPFSASSHAPRT